MALPFSPQSADEHRRRYNAAVLVTINQDDVESGKRPAPSSQSEHVFDFSNGLRLIVSREISALGTGIHISASVIEGTTAHKTMLAARKSVKARQDAYLAFCLHCIERWQYIANDNREPEFLGMSRSRKAVPHWFLREDLKQA